MPPKFDNLKTHLSWALSNDAFKPKDSFLDSPKLQQLLANSKTELNEEPAPVKSAEVTATAPTAATTAFQFEDEEELSSDPIILQQSNTLPTPPSNPLDSFDSSDSDLEYFAHLSGNSKPNYTEELVEENKQEDETGAAAAAAAALSRDLQIIDTSSASSLPATPIKPRENASAPFRLTQAPESDMDPPKQEIGSVLSEKIALLEQKVRLLSNQLEANGIRCDTTEINGKLREVERRIEQFPGNDDFGAFNLESSPQILPGATAGLPMDINNDDFDSDFVIDTAPKIREFSEFRPTKPVSEPVEIDDDDDDDDNDIEEIAWEKTHAQHDEGHAVNSLGDEDSVYQNLLEEEGESMITATNTILPSQYISQTPAQQQHQQQQHQQQQQQQQTTQTHPWTKEMMHILRTKFGLQGFRPNQVEAINETLSGNDVVVLMPTGGGKSLCYQLPALVTSGSTHGTTVVISPLISLMQDQVYHLKNRGIQAEMLNSKLNASERSQVFQMLNSGDLQLLYLSPEMLSISGAMRSTLQRLYLANKLARIVIDEAHCVSAWGHDFRPEYMELTKVKTEFPATPIMALTATANERVLLDIVGCLRSNPMVLKQSFNRRNLYYEVRSKSGAVLDEIARVCLSHRGQSGIIYCHSKRNCEDTAKALKRWGISTDYYHAGMPQESRAEVQHNWQVGKCSVVCATIAFGMGIDKPDVRFVIHLTLPRNIEGYYQETGRAGRDGKVSQCILFYNYRDVQMLQKMIQQDTQLSHQVREHHRALLIRVMQYCENKTDCRRQQVLQYFNEDFHKRQCRNTCDNCRRVRDQGAVSKDMTVEARNVVQLLQQISAQHITLQQLTDILMGRKTQKIKSCGFDKIAAFGMLNDSGILLVERLVHALVTERIIEEFSQYNHSRFPQSYIRLGPMSGAVMSGNCPLKLTMPRDFANPASAAAAGAASSASGHSHAHTTTTRAKRPRAAGFRNSKRSRN